MEGYVYILKFKISGRYYIGSTVNFKRRLVQHLRGHTYTTKKFGEFEVKLVQRYQDIKEAHWVERKIKSWKRKDFIDKMVVKGKILIKPFN